MSIKHPLAYKVHSNLLIYIIQENEVEIDYILRKTERRSVLFVLVLIIATQAEIIKL